MTTKEKIDIDIIRIRILKDFERKFLECREIGFEKVLDGILRKHLQEPTEEREVEIKLFYQKPNGWEGDWYYSCKKCGGVCCLKGDKYCSQCGAKIKRIS